MYKRTLWQDHVEGVQEGTPLSAANLNNIEVGTMEANALAALNAEYRRYCTDNAKNSEVFSTLVSLSGSGELHFVSLEGGERNNLQYRVDYEIASVGSGTAGDIVILSKQANGFSVKYFGTSSWIQVIFYISGGMI